MKRFFIATGIFCCAIMALELPNLVRMLHLIREEHGTSYGVYFSFGPPSGILLGTVAIGLLALVAYWLAGKLVRTRPR